MVQAKIEENSGEGSHVSKRLNGKRGQSIGVEQLWALGGQESEKCSKLE